VPDHAGLAEWEISPRSFWNQGLWTDDPAGLDSWAIERHPVSAVPFTADAAPVVVRGRGAQLRGWTMDGGSAGRLPDSPVSTGLPMQELRLVPYGSARIRIAEFPTVALDHVIDDDQ